MLEAGNNSELPPIPGKRYFTIGEVSELCGVKPHVLRYWEQEFPQLKPVKRRGNRRYYQRQDVLVIRQIRSLLYEQGFTIGGARNRLQGDEARDDLTQAQQIVRQIRTRAGRSPAHPAPLTSVEVRARCCGPQRCSRRVFEYHSRAFAYSRRTAAHLKPVGTWRSLVAHLHGVQGVASSNLAVPTNSYEPSRSSSSSPGNGTCEDCSSRFAACIRMGIS